MSNTTNEHEGQSPASGATAVYTAGPWTARRVMTRDSYYGSIPAYEIDGERWEGLATVHCSGDDALLGDTARGEANAWLIAAAPELYEALERLWDYYCSGLWCDEDDDLMRRLVNRAMAKALGEAV